MARLTDGTIEETARARAANDWRHRVRRVRWAAVASGGRPSRLVGGRRVRWAAVASGGVVRRLPDDVETVLFLTRLFAAVGLPRAAGGGRASLAEIDVFGRVELRAGGFNALA
ncbi:hypothetical protein SAMN06265347_101286 [Halobellus salinus]|nr:hypothetical protein SAMN06265347_101286 [Halobellus salinus]